MLPWNDVIRIPVPVSRLLCADRVVDPNVGKIGAHFDRNVYGSSRESRHTANLGINRIPNKRDLLCFHAMYLFTTGILGEAMSDT